VSDKAKIRHSIKDLQRIKTWQLIILLIIVGFVAATFLRLNNIGMIQRRDAVISADKAGDEEATINRLYDLQRYVSAHMNTNLGTGVVLDYAYSRDLEAWQQSQYGDANPNGNIYKKAQDVCAPKFNHYSYAYLQCTTNELARYPAASVDIDTAGKPIQATYVHMYTSPVWSSDFAGWSVLIFLFIIALIVIRFVSLGVLHLMLRRRYKQL